MEIGLLFRVQYGVFAVLPLQNWPLQICCETNFLLPVVCFIAIKVYLMRTRIMTLLVLVLIMVTDLGPVPTVSLICLYAVIFRPLWFKRLVDEIYR